LHFSSLNPLTYTGTDNCIWTAQGIINEDPGFMITLYATGTQTFLDANGASGPIDYAGFTLSSVPIPGALWLFGSGLLGLLGVRRKMIF
jgi:hypothetical protein